MEFVKKDDIPSMMENHKIHVFPVSTKQNLPMENMVIFHRFFLYVYQAGSYDMISSSVAILGIQISFGIPKKNESLWTWGPPVMFVGL